MSKLIKLPQDILDQYTKEFYETLRSGKIFRWESKLHKNTRDC